MSTGFHTKAFGACHCAGQCERSLRRGVSMPDTARPYSGREGEEARCFLAECAERFLRRNALEGYEAHTRAGLAAVRRDVEAGRPDVPACDIVAAEIKRVHGMPMCSCMWECFFAAVLPAIGLQTLWRRDEKLVRVCRYERILILTS